MKFFGTVRDSKNKVPVKDANIKLKIKNAQIASVYSNETGKFEYSTEKDYTGERLDITVEKDGFETQHSYSVVDVPKKQLDFLLKPIKSKEPSDKSKPTLGTGNKLRISGTILNSRNNEPIQSAQIKLKIKNVEIDTVYSDGQGRFEYNTETDYVGQILDYTIEKQCFKSESYTYEINQPEIQLNIPLDEIEIQIKGKISDGKTNKSLERANSSFKINKEYAQNITSDKEGDFSFAVPCKYQNEFIEYEASKEGYQTGKDKLQVKDNLYIEIKLFREMKNRIYGTIKNSKNKAPVPGAKIMLKIKNTQIASVESDEYGTYKYSTQTDYTGEDLYVIVEKPGFESKLCPPHKIEGETQLNILMDEIVPEIKIKGKTFDGTENPLEGANISFKINNEFVQNIISNEGGNFSLALPGKYLDGFIEYEASKQGYQTKSERIQLKDNLNIAILLNRIEPLPLDINCTLNRNYLPQRGGWVYLGIDIKPQKTIESIETRLPLSICLLIDCSASMMEGEKIKNAKKAALEFIEKLDTTDYAGIVTFADKVLVISKGEHVVDKNSFKDKINKIAAGGLTELYKGLEKAYEELKKPTQTVYGRAREPVREIILLSDGQPTDSEPHARYAKLAKDIRNSGISIAALGLGNDYNEDLLSELAVNSGGMWQHITSAEDISSVFSRELDSAKSVLYTRPRLILHPRTGVEVSTVYMFHPEIYMIDDKDRNLLRDIKAGETQRIVAKLHIPQRQEIKNDEVVEIHVKVAKVELSINTDFIKSSTSKDVIAKYSKDDSLLAMESDAYPRSMFMTSEATLMGKKAISDKTVLRDVKDKIDTIMKDPGATKIQETQVQLTKLREAISKPSSNEEDKKKTKSEMTKTRFRL